MIGILKPTGTPNDRVVFVNIEGFYLLEEHAKPVPNGDERIDFNPGTRDRVEPLPAEQREVTAILIALKRPVFGARLAEWINDGTIAQAVVPAQELQNVRDNNVSLFLELAQVRADFKKKGEAIPVRKLRRGEPIKGTGEHPFEDNQEGDDG